MAELGVSIAIAAEQLIAGKLVAIPTETVYGLAANALDANAVAKIFEAKNRPFFDPLIVHVASVEEVEKYCTQLPVNWKALLSYFWPGPLTFLFKRKPNIPDITVAGSDWVAMRMPQHDLTLQLLLKLDFPLAAPSANPFGYISPTTAQHVQLNLGDRIDYILDGGACNVGIESTIIKVEGNNCTVLRLGGLAIQELNSFFETVHLEIANNSNPNAPGQLDKHYSPSKPIELVSLNTLLKPDEQTVYVRWKKLVDHVPADRQFVLSPNGDLVEAAVRLFNYLRLADAAKNANKIIAELVPNEGLGLAINDRLKRAAAK